MSTPLINDDIMKKNMKYALFGAALALVTPSYAAAPDCYTISTSVKTAVAENPEKVLELVAAEVAQNESCACEIVKAAICLLYTSPSPRDS